MKSKQTEMYKPRLMYDLCSQEDCDPPIHESLSIENTLWASTVVASGKQSLFQREFSFIEM